MDELGEPGGSREHRGEHGTPDNRETGVEGKTWTNGRQDKTHWGREMGEPWPKQRKRYRDKQK